MNNEALPKIMEEKEQNQAFGEEWLTSYIAYKYKERKK